jgi:hypothetical protein
MMGALCEWTESTTATLDLQTGAARLHSAIATIRWRRAAISSALLPRRHPHDKFCAAADDVLAAKERRIFFVRLSCAWCPGG